MQVKQCFTLFFTSMKSISIHLFYKQLVYKQLALEWQITKQLEGFYPLLLSINKNNRFKVELLTTLVKLTLVAYIKKVY